MGKRSNFERHPRGLYPTPESAVRPLLLHLPSAVCFDAPCAGDGALVRHLEAEGHSLGATSDIQPMAAGIATSDARGIERCTGEMFITNPPWPEPNRRGDPTLSILMHLSSLAPTWLLLPADFAHNIYFHKVADRCRKIVSVGRVKWIPGTRGPGKDNAARYLFDEARDGRTHFYGRSEPPPAALETGRLHTNAEQYCSAKQPYKGKVMKLEQNQKEKAFYECIRPHVENVVANEFGIVFENLLAPGDLYDHIIEQIMHDLW